MNNLNKIPIHDSSLRHSTGQAIYIDDMPEQENLLHGAPVLSKVACGKIKKINSDKLKDLPFFTKIIIFQCSMIYFPPFFFCSIQQCYTFAYQH